VEHLLGASPNGKLLASLVTIRLGSKYAIVFVLGKPLEPSIVLAGLPKCSTFELPGASLKGKLLASLVTIL